VRILVTGGAGFIGSHMADRLVREGNDVTVVDSEATGLRANVPTGAEYLKGDVARAEDLEPAFGRGIDGVFHIAGQVSLVGSFTDPLRDLRTNVEGTMNVLQLCLQHRVPRLIYASSMTVYGRVDLLPTPDDAPCRPISYYGIGKYAAERYVHSTAEREDLDFDFNVTSFRMYNVYGPRQALNNPYQGVLGIFLGQILRGEPLTIYGDGEQSRDFVYVDDVVDAWLAAWRDPASHGQVLSLGSGRRLSINDLADSVLSAFRRSRADYDVVYRDARPGEQRHVEADIRRTRDLLGWQPRVDFAHGLRETVTWAVGQVAGLEGVSGRMPVSRP
jgi:UDP-glucose 4-epimerase